MEYEKDQEILTCGGVTTGSSPSSMENNAHSVNVQPKLTMMKTRAFGCRSRTKYSAKQVDILEASFHENHYPDTATLENLACASDVSMDKVNVWFQNRRSKFKKQSKGKHMNWMRSQIFDHVPETETCHVLSPPSESTSWRHSPNLHYYSQKLSILDTSTGLLGGDPNSPSTSVSKSPATVLTGRDQPSLPPHPGAMLARPHQLETQHENISNVDRLRHGLHLQPYMLALPLPSDDQVMRYVNKRKTAVGYDLSRISANPLTLGHLMNDFPPLSQSGEQASKPGISSRYTSRPALQHHMDSNVSVHSESLRPHPIRYTSLDTSDTSECCQAVAPAIPTLPLPHSNMYRYDHSRCSTPLTCPNVDILYDPLFIR